jgi:O-acetyl-ADP-ribose deacetylase (regulator of RNase III)
VVPALVGDDTAVIALEIQQADVTRLDVDAITNAANTQLKHGGGVAAAISRAGGPAVQRESTEGADRPRRRGRDHRR